MGGGGAGSLTPTKKSMEERCRAARAQAAAAWEKLQSEAAAAAAAAATGRHVPPLHARARERLRGLRVLGQEHQEASALGQEHQEAIASRGRPPAAAGALAGSGGGAGTRRRRSVWAVLRRVRRTCREAVALHAAIMASVATAAYSGLHVSEILPHRELVLELAARSAPCNRLFFLFSRSPARTRPHIHTPIHLYCQYWNSICVLTMAATTRQQALSRSEACSPPHMSALRLCRRDGPPRRRASRRSRPHSTAAAALANARRTRGRQRCLPAGGGTCAGNGRKKTEVSLARAGE